MSSLVKRILTGGSLAVGVVLLLVADRHLPAGLVPWGMASLLAALGVWELVRMGTLRAMRLGRSLGAAVVVVVVASFLIALGVVEAPEWLTTTRTLGLFYVLAGITAVLVDAVAGPKPGFRAGFVLVLALWAVPPLFGLGLVQAQWGTTGLAVLVLLAKIGDIFGYFVGRKIGKRHPFTRLSPGKTVAGCVASLVAGIVAGIVVAATDLMTPGALGIFAGALAGLTINIVSQAGDLAESWVKRFAGVKDSSGLVGASGGVLDVVDSLLLATPTAMLVFPLVFVS